MAKDNPESNESRQQRAPDQRPDTDKKDLPFGHGLLDDAPAEEAPAEPRAPEAEKSSPAESAAPVAEPSPPKSPVAAGQLAFGHGIRDEVEDRRERDETPSKPPPPESAVPSADEPERPTSEPVEEDDAEAKTEAIEMSLAATTDEPVEPISEDEESSDDIVLAYKIVEPPDDDEDDFAKIPPGPMEEVEFDRPRPRGHFRERRGRGRPPRKPQPREREPVPAAPGRSKSGVPVWALALAAIVLAAAAIWAIIVWVGNL